MSRTIEEFFAHILPEKLVAKPPNAAQRSAIIKITLAGDDGGTWTIDLTKSPGAVVLGDVSEPTCTINVDAADFEAMLAGRATTMRLFMQRRIRVTGSISHATYLQSVVD